MNQNESLATLQFLREAERLKNVYRSAWTSGGQPESTAAHTWRLCLVALVLAPHFPEVDSGRLLKICVVHDLGEAIGGDIPAIYQQANAPKAAQERNDLLTLVEPLPAAIKQEIVELWDEYEAAATPEARLAKALDKLETLLQHNQGANPPDFDYAFNLHYGKKFTDAVPLVAELRAMVDEETRHNAVQFNGYRAGTGDDEGDGAGV
ncbi:MAG: HD domain-containing protein [Chloroflexaceae bacterium]|jgi:putative hydrolase of HD superfamily|nr:HD domain-containing protein [Chloroflexaceae bacterium]